MLAPGWRRTYRDAKVAVRTPCISGAGNRRGHLVSVSTGAHPLNSCLLRVWSPAGVVGAGFLLGEGLAVTCAHVVNAASGVDPYHSDLPSAPVKLDFPYFHSTIAWGRVPEGGWLPPRRGDVALLRLQASPDRAGDGRVEPDGARAAPLRLPWPVTGHPFTVPGYPSGVDTEVWARGRRPGVGHEGPRGRRDDRLVLARSTGCGPRSRSPPPP